MQSKIFLHCPACQSKDSKIAFQPNDETIRRFRELSRVKYGGFMDTWSDRLPLIIRECLNCRHLWYHTQPDQESIFAMYNAGRPLSNGKKPEDRPSERMLREMRALYHSMLKRGVKRPSILDYGSGRGLWAYSAVIAGFRVCAYEPSKERVTKNESVSGFRTIHHLEELQGEKFDVVNMEQVLEHTQYPVETLMSVKTYCRAETILRITVPNVARYGHNDKLWAGFPFNGRTIHIMSPFEHLQGFNPRSLEITLKRAGLVMDDSMWGLLTKPFYTLRYLAGKIIPSVGPTLAVVHFNNEQ